MHDITQDSSTGHKATLPGTRQHEAAALNLKSFLNCMEDAVHSELGAAMLVFLRQSSKAGCCPQLSWQVILMVLNCVLEPSQHGLVVDKVAPVALQPQQTIQCMQALGCHRPVKVVVCTFACIQERSNCSTLTVVKLGRASALAVAHSSCPFNQLLNTYGIQDDVSTQAYVVSPSSASHISAAVMWEVCADVQDRYIQHGGTDPLMI